MLKVGIIGAGLVGRLLAWHLCQKKCEIHLYSKDSIEGEGACSIIAAGMISPLAEISLLSQRCYAMGLQSLTLWPRILSTLEEPVFYCNSGTLVVTHHTKMNLLKHFILNIQSKIPEISLPLLSGSDLRIYEPSLNSLIGCYLPDESWIDPKQLFSALGNYLIKQGVHWHPQLNIAHAANIDADKVFDCRGLGAKAELPLRGVRGEIIEVRAPDVRLQHTIRLLHPRAGCYIIPRENNIYAVGATQIENEFCEPISISSALDLLSACVSVHSGFYEANIVNMYADCRPTCSSAEPFVLEKDRITYINGMYRHGFLLAPSLTAEVAARF